MAHTIVSRWRERLQLFLHRNTGRCVTMQVRHFDHTIQREVRRMPLTGLDLDAHAHNVEIMLGSKSVHFSHSISGVTSVYFFASPTASGDVLIIEHGGAQTIISAQASEANYETPR